MPALDTMPALDAMPRQANDWKWQSKKRNSILYNSKGDQMMWLMSEHRCVRVSLQTWTAHEMMARAWGSIRLVASIGGMRIEP